MHIFSRWPGLLLTGLLLLSTPSLASPLKLAYAENWPPYSYPDAEGKAQGILVELMDSLLAKQMGLEVQHHLLPWKRAQKQVEMGQYDAYMAVPTADRLAFANRSQHVLYWLKVKAFLSRKSPRIGELTAMINPLNAQQLDCIVLLGDRSSNEIAAQHNKQCNSVDSVPQALKMLAAGRADLFIHAEAVANDLITRMDLADQLFEHPIVLRQQQSVLLVSKGSSFTGWLLEQLDNQLSNGEVELPHQ